MRKDKKKGFITFEELAKSLQGLDMDADSLDQLYNSFIEAGISVITEEEATSEEGGAKKVMKKQEIFLQNQIYV